MKHIVLVGAGHAHVKVLRDWRRLPNVQLSVITPTIKAPYSGMVPGWLAGEFSFSQLEIDCAPLCARAGATWIATEVTRLDPSQQMVFCANGQALHYDYLSFNNGSTVEPLAVPAHTLLSLRPLSTLRLEYDRLLADWCDPRHSAALAITVVGGGAAGVETTIALTTRLRALRPDRTVAATLYQRGADIVPNLAPRARQLARAQLTRLNVKLYCSTEWTPQLAKPTTADQQQLIVWASGALAHAWQRNPEQRSALAVSDAGFIRIDRQLRSVSHPNIFAVGDCAHFDAKPLPKAGVFSVKMGAVLSRQLQALATTKEAHHSYWPQQKFLVILACYKNTAIATRGHWALAGRWVRRWKRWIDQRFLRRLS